MSVIEKLAHSSSLPSKFFLQSEQSTVNSKSKNLERLNELNSGVICEIEEQNRWLNHRIGMMESNLIETKIRILKNEEKTASESAHRIVTEESS